MAESAACVCVLDLALRWGKGDRSEGVSFFPIIQTPVSLFSLFTQINVLSSSGSDSKGEMGQAWRFLPRRDPRHNHIWSHEDNKRKFRRDGSNKKKKGCNKYSWHLKLHVLLFCLNLCIREDLLKVIKHFHLKIALIRSLPLTWTHTWQNERVHVSAVKQTRCCSGKGS